MNQPLHQALRFTPFFTILAVAFSAIAGPPKTSQHASFKPQDFERIAVIVKPFQGQQSRSFGMGMGGRRGQAQAQTSPERMVEQNFMRVLLKKGFTLVSRADLDAAMVEKGLDQAKMTDEKYSEEAGKILHVSALMVVSVDAYNVQQLQAAAPGGNGHPSYGYGNTRTYLQFTAAIAARLVKINDNMVMWTGDYSLSENLTAEGQDSLALGSMAEAIATAFPPLLPAKNDIKESPSK